MSNAPEEIKDMLDDFERALKHIVDHGDEYQRRQDFYDGKNKEIIAHPKLQALLQRYGGEKFALTYAAVPVDALMDRVDLSSLVVDGDDTLTKRFAEEVWEPNELDDDADDYHARAAYLGDYYVIAWPSVDDPETIGNEGGSIELSGKHPRNAVIIYDRENDRIPEFGAFRWSTGKKSWRANLIYDDVTVELEAMNTEDPNKADDWRVVLDGESGEPSLVPNETGMFPMFHFRPDAKPYGRPVNSRAYGPQNAITKIQATELGSIDYLGYPQRYALLDPQAEEGDDIAEDFNDEGTTDGPGADTDPSRVVSRENGKIDATPGSAWLLSGVKGVGQFDAADPDGFIAAKADQIRAMATLCRTPLRAFGIDDSSSGGDSGEARRRDEAPMVKHAKKIQGTFGSTWSAIGTFILKSWGVGADKKVTATWAPPELATDKDGLELVGAKISNGVPPRQALIEAGYSTTQLDDWMPEGDIAWTPAQIVQITGAIQTMSQGVALGPVTIEDVRELFKDFLPGPAPEPEPPAPVVVADAAPIPVPGELNADGTPKVAPPKGIVPPALASTMLPSKG